MFLFFAIFVFVCGLKAHQVYVATLDVRHPLCAPSRQWDGELGHQTRPSLPAELSSLDSCRCDTFHLKPAAVLVCNPHANVSKGDVRSRMFLLAVQSSR